MSGSRHAKPTTADSTISHFYRRNVQEYPNHYRKQGGKHDFEAETTSSKTTTPIQKLVIQKKQLDTTANTNKRIPEYILSLVDKEENMGELIKM